MKLLAIGGPKHGQELPYIDRGLLRHVLNVPIMPDLKAMYFGPYCVHGGDVRSATDGQVHYVPALRVAGLYRLHRSEYRLADSYLPHRPALSGAEAKRCLYPDPTGRYTHPGLDDSLTIRVARYETRVVSDRLVWVFIG